jgi:hypothetical protein
MIESPRICSFKTRILELKKIQSEFVIENIHAYGKEAQEIMIRDAADKMFFRLTAAVVTENHSVTVDVGPASLKDWIVHTYGNDWIKKKFPVKMKQKTFTLQALYPEYKLAPSQIGQGFITIMEEK